MGERDDEPRWQPHWKPLHVGQIVRVRGTRKLKWIVTAFEKDSPEVTLELRDERTGQHFEHVYLKDQIEPVF